MRRSGANYRSIMRYLAGAKRSNDPDHVAAIVSRMIKQESRGETPIYAGRQGWSDMIRDAIKQTESLPVEDLKAIVREELEN